MRIIVMFSPKLARHYNQYLESLCPILSTTFSNYLIAYMWCCGQPDSHLIVNTKKGKTISADGKVAGNIDQYDNYVEHLIFLMR